MLFALLIYENEARFATGNDYAELAEYRQFGDKYKDQVQGGKALEPTDKARSIRVRGGESIVSDGPFAETKEQLGGFYLLEAENIEAAVKAAAEIPGARFGTVEVRPVMVFS